MTLEQLEAVISVVECGSFRAAAEKTHRSQPALSVTIKNLEEEFGLLIFDRSEYRPKLTEAGAAFVNVARATLHSASYAARVAHELGKNKVETKLHVSVDPLISIEIIEIVAHECGRPLLPVSLIMERSILKSSLEPLLDGKIDLAFAPCPRNDERIETIPLEEVTLVGAVLRKLLQEKRKATETFLSEHPQIIVYDRSFDEPPDELLPNAIKSGLKHKIFVPDHYTKLRLIQSGLGWGRISRTEFDQSEELVLIDKSVFSHVTLELCLMRSKHRPIGPTACKIWDLFAQRENSVAATKATTKKKK